LYENYPINTRETTAINTIYKNVWDNISDIIIENWKQMKADPFEGEGLKRKPKKRVRFHGTGLTSNSTNNDTKNKFNLFTKW